MIERYQPQDATEADDLARITAMVAGTADPWTRAGSLHLTASALIVHPPTGRILLRWHERQQAWLQVGGHADPGEVDPLTIALREGREETGLTDLVGWPAPKLVHVVVVPVASWADEPAHEHADLRFVLATDDPGAVRPEGPTAPVRWFTPAEAAEMTSEPNLRESIHRVSRLLAAPHST